MARYHVNGEGNVGLCRARGDSCPFGSRADHHASREQAQQAYELEQGNGFDRPMDHAPRANWIVPTASAERRAFVTYRASLRSLRATRSRSTAAQLKQQALAQASARSGMPLSQVKSIVRLEQERLRMPTAQDDPQRQAALQFRQASDALLAAAGNRPRCACGSTTAVMVRADPIEARLFAEQRPVLACYACHRTAFEEAEELA